ncbi:MAG: glycosyltransferase family protein [Thermaurantimonas sp.]
METPPSVLICVLNWGYGHAARCTIIAKQLLQQGHRVYVASDGEALTFLKNHLENCIFIPLPEYRIKYSKSGKWLILKMIFTFFWMLPIFVREWIAIRKSVKKYTPDILISDTRPFCHTFKIPSIYITNQIEIRPFTLGVIHRLQMRLFDRIWIPSIEDDPIGGFTTRAFGHMKAKTTYIGYIPNYSDFTTEKKEKKYEIAAILSGPEPARTQMENLIRQELKKISQPTVLVRGIAGGSETPRVEGHVIIFDFLPLEGVADIVSQSKIYLGRSGFSGISMLVGLPVKAIVIPTQGQPEQEANAASMAQNGIAVAYRQEDFNLTHALEKIQSIKSLQHIKNHRCNFAELIKPYKSHNY